MRRRHVHEDLRIRHGGQGLMNAGPDGRQHGVPFEIPVLRLLQPLPPRHPALPEHGHRQRDHREAEQEDADDDARHGRAALRMLGRPAFENEKYWRLASDRGGGNDMRFVGEKAAVSGQDGCGETSGRLLLSELKTGEW
ncbi:hypothetical protein PG994_008256 [Apiospora phragmitis]|uniref:Uncharacterized protein n=1 Tax=Apiospora phragmitis TaxID=2905665 RepID=A0ABR1USJ8_9PEZI